MTNNIYFIDLTLTAPCSLQEASWYSLKSRIIPIFLFIACKIRKYLTFIRKTQNMPDAVRVKL